jgi:hypothetical protein
MPDRTSSWLVVGPAPVVIGFMITQILFFYAAVRRRLPSHSAASA